MQQPTHAVAVSTDVPRSGKICTAVNTDATQHHHKTLSESVAFLDNIWHVLLTTVLLR